MNRRMRYALLKCYAKIDGNCCRTHFKIVIVFWEQKRTTVKPLSLAVARGGLEPPTL